ncbi:hypothetical protein WJX73_008462 [Symbiochloris irregularis]|uniref:Uncharacterized protein n=1 Tax=Symbiochloris irregularis TaxID=706552 RepID=A0AAW1PJ66_9CHLO
MVCPAHMQLPTQQRPLLPLITHIHCNLSWQQPHRHRTAASCRSRAQGRPRLRDRTCAVAEAVASEQPAASVSSADTLTDGQIGVPVTANWELDFSSRPVYDERGKKRWELLVCSPDGSWKFAQYFPNNKINSGQLKATLGELLAQPGAKKPDRVRFFRNQMQTIISRALSELEIKPVPSRRCFHLLGWLQARQQEVYAKDPTYKASSVVPFALDPSPPEDLPDALKGEQWSFVQLPLGTLQEELELVDQKSIFGANISLDSIGLGDLSEETLVPGVAVYSRRAQPMAAWTAGFEVANLFPDTERACLIMEVAVNRRFKYGAYRRSADSTAEAKSWQEAKEASRGLHFLVVQSDPDAEESKGLWLLLEKELPSI